MVLGEASNSGSLHGLPSSLFGKLRELSYVPITDKERYGTPLMREAQMPVEHRGGLTSLRLEVLEDLLPAPKSPPSRRGGGNGASHLPKSESATVRPSGLLPDWRQSSLLVSGASAAHS